MSGGATTETVLTGDTSRGAPCQTLAMARYDTVRTADPAGTENDAPPVASWAPVATVDQVEPSSRCSSTGRVGRSGPKSATRAIVPPVCTVAGAVSVDVCRSARSTTSGVCTAGCWVPPTTAASASTR